MSRLLKIDSGAISLAVKNGEDLKPQPDIDSFIETSLQERINSERRDARDEGHGRGKRETLSVKEKELREKFDLKGATIDEMFTEYGERNQVVPDMSPDEVRKTDIYKNDVGKLRDQVKTLEASNSSIIADHKAKDVMSKIRDRSAPILEKYKFVLPEDVLIRDNILKTIFNGITSKGYTVALDENDEFVIQDEDGNVKMNDKTVQPVTFEERFVDTARGYLTTAKSDDRQNAGNRNGEGDQRAAGVAAGDYKFTMPADGNEYFNTLTTIKTPEERNAYKEFYQANGGE